jgi:RimJ/RimL family protein N-acetyltransferase
VRTADECVAGCTRFLELRPHAVEIGGTWLSASAQRTGINIEAKLLLLTYAFEERGVGRVELKTDARNDRSRAAIAAIGASFEGVLRNYQPSHATGEDGKLRDTAMYSIVDTEWPGVRARLRDRLRWVDS